MSYLSLGHKIRKQCSQRSASYKKLTNNLLSLISKKFRSMPKEKKTSVSYYYKAWNMVKIIKMFYSMYNVSLFVLSTCMYRETIIKSVVVHTTYEDTFSGINTRVLGINVCCQLWPTDPHQWWLYVDFVSHKSSLHVMTTFVVSPPIVRSESSQTNAQRNWGDIAYDTLHVFSGLLAN